MKIICALAVSITVESLDGIIFYSLFSTLGIFADLKKPQKITLSTMENHIHGKKSQIVKQGTKQFILFLHIFLQQSHPW